jgi:cytochrome c oxidase subunit II
LASHSPGTDQIDTLFWIGFLAAAILIVAVVGALLYVVRRYRSERGVEPRQLLGGRGLQFRVGGVLTVFAALLFILGIVFTDNAREKPSTGDAGLASLKSEPLKIEATGQQWLWRYDYPNGAFSYYKLVVPVDTAVELALESTDVVHTWNVEELARKADAVPGKTNKVFFSTGDEGNYLGDSATLSGQAYAAMRTEVEVVSPEDYEEFVDTQLEEIETAQETVVSQIEKGDTP